MNVKKSCNLAWKKLPVACARAFTLIELLVVIAIISILAALIFPVFSSAQESSRQSSTMTHLQQIQSGLALYKLDNQSSPQVLFSYAYPGVAMNNTAQIAQNESLYAVGSLFPTYVKDYHDFMSQDNPVDDNLSQYVSLTSYELPSSSTTGYPTLTGIARNYYVMDGFDVSPKIAGPSNPNQFINGNTAADLQYVIRYERDWTSVQNLTATDTLDSSSTQHTFGDDTGPYYDSYLHQLRWKNPPSDSYVTCTTYHVPNGNKIIVLFESGSVAKITPTQLGGNYGPNASFVTGFNDSVSCSNASSPSGTPPAAETCNLDGNNDNPAQFWKISNTQ